MGVGSDTRSREIGSVELLGLYIKATGLSTQSEIAVFQFLVDARHGGDQIRHCAWAKPASEPDSWLTHTGARVIPDAGVVAD